jgi:hypothetical protein
MAINTNAFFGHNSTNDHMPFGLIPRLASPGPRLKILDKLKDKKYRSKPDYSSKAAAGNRDKSTF